MIEEKTIIDKREQILEAAERLFAERGFDAVSVRELAKEANVNLAMISYYFGSKDKMYETLIENRISVTRTAIKNVNEKNITPIEKLNAVIDIYVEKMMNNRKFQRILSREMFQNTRPELNVVINESINKNKLEVSTIINEGIRKKQFRKVDVDMTIMTMISTVSHLVSACKFSQNVFHKASEEELYTMQFKTRIKNHLKELLANHLLLEK